MNQLLSDRASGNARASKFTQAVKTQRIHSFQLAPRIRFNGGEREIISNDASLSTQSEENAKLWAHQAGVNALDIDIDNRLLISGGADSSIKIWDLQQHTTGFKHTFGPTGSIARNASAHKFGITHLSFYPFDSAAFLSSSYDHHLKIYATETLTVSADFDLNSIVYTHAISPIAEHVLVACATQHPSVRLVDLHSGASTHSLAGHHGAVLAVSWSPTKEHILASGGVDGCVRIWDVRKSSGALGVLDLEDSTGVVGYDGMRGDARSRYSGKAHSAAVNGLTWTEDGSHLISAGHDNRVRVWDTGTGANTLASFGPTVKNGHLSTLPLIVSPSSLMAPGKELLFYPNEKEILVFEMHEGRLLKRFKIPGPKISTVRSRTGERNTQSRITAMVWRGCAEGMYSAHTDGQIRGYLPRTPEDDILDKEEEETTQSEGVSEESTKKRKVLEDVFRDLTRQKITFG